MTAYRQIGTSGRGAPTRVGRKCGRDDRPETPINPVPRVYEARLATSFHLLAGFAADCATVALPQIRETEQLSECSHSPTLRSGSTVQPSLARPLDHRMEIPESVPLRAESRQLPPLEKLSPQRWKSWSSTRRLLHGCRSQHNRPLRKWRRRFAQNRIIVFCCIAADVHFG
jgi:hypothetical protein